MTIYLVIITHQFMYPFTIYHLQFTIYHLPFVVGGVSTLLSARLCAFCVVCVLHGSHKLTQIQEYAQM